MGDDNEKTEKPADVAGTIRPWVPETPVTGRMRGGLAQVARYIAVNSSTEVAFKTFDLNPIENPDISEDLLNLEQEAFNTPRVVLRAYVENESLSLDQIGLQLGRAEEEHARTVVMDVLRRRDATEADTVNMAGAVFQYIGSLFRIAVTRMFGSE